VRGILSTNLHSYKLLAYICSMGKNKKNNYRIVTKLPQSAVKVADYAANWPCNTSYLYKLVREKKNILKFEIVDFHGINFIIPD